MTVNELIEKLQKLEEEHGDVDILMVFNEGFWSSGVNDVSYSDVNNSIIIEGD